MTTATLEPSGSGRRAAESGLSKEPNWSALVPLEVLDWAPCPCPPTATPPLLEGAATTAVLGQRGSGQEPEESGPSKETNWSAPGALGAVSRAPFPSPATVTRPLWEDSATTATLGPRGSGRGAEESGLNRELNWSARVVGASKAAPCRLAPMAILRSSVDMVTMACGFGRGVAEFGPSREVGWLVRVERDILNLLRCPFPPMATRLPTPDLSVTVASRPHGYGNGSEEFGPSWEPS